jgi:hypothetical protein
MILNMHQDWYMRYDINDFVLEENKLVLVLKISSLFRENFTFSPLPIGSISILSLSLPGAPT